MSSPQIILLGIFAAIIGLNALSRLTGTLPWTTLVFNRFPWVLPLVLPVLFLAPLYMGHYDRPPWVYLAFGGGACFLGLVMWLRPLWYVFHFVAMNAYLVLLALYVRDWIWVAEVLLFTEVLLFAVLASTTEKDRPPPARKNRRHG